MMQYRVRRFFGHEIDQVPFYLVVVACLALIATVFACSVRAQEYDPALIERPAPPLVVELPGNVICSEGQRPSCHPVNDPLCHGWCETAEYSYGDVFWLDGVKYKVHWASCQRTTMEEQALIQALRARCGRKCRGL